MLLPLPEALRTTSGDLLCIFETVHYFMHAMYMNSAIVLIVQFMTLKIK